MRILFINNQGAGFADYLDVSAGTSVEKFFEKQMSGGKPDDYLIRVNRQPVSRDQVLQEGDRVSITPTKIEGAKGLPGRNAPDSCPTGSCASCSSCGVIQAQDEAVRNVGKMVPVAPSCAHGRPWAFMGLNLASTGPVAVA